jgi:ferredoxin--NADP+ reductase
MNKSIIKYSLGSKERPLRVAIVGAGPAGFYAAETLLKENSIIAEVDLFDRLPTPYGLVRGGVAPDHQNIKAITRIFERIAALPRFHFFGNVELGKHFSLEELQYYYDQVLLAVGCPIDRQLEISGENLHGSHSATSLVGWYNSHPDFCHEKFDFSSVEKVAVIGIGNVALDVVRILMQEPEKLACSDIFDNALTALKNSNIREVYLIGRRGPAQAAFTLKEIEELAELETAELTFETNEIKAVDLSTDPKFNDGAIKNMKYMRDRLKQPSIEKQKYIRIRFLLSPVEILGENGKIKAIKLEKNHIMEDEYGNLQAKGTGQFEILPIDMVFRSIGYRGIPLPDIPFDKMRGIIPNQDGRVINLTNKIMEGVYVTGWAKRGPSGLIGTNRRDSIAVAQLMIADSAKRQEHLCEQKTSQAAHRWVSIQQPNYVSFNNWLTLNKIELERGNKKGKIRDKFDTIIEMQSCLIDDIKSDYT